MTAALLVVAGTGTGIGKTHVTCAILQAWARALGNDGTEVPRVAGLKPVESGVRSGAGSSAPGSAAVGPSDARALEQASTFHVKRFPPPYMLVRAVSPHLAAADEGRAIELSVIHAYVAAVRAETDAVAVELAGGLFSPLAAGLCNADVARALDADAVILLAPDRLGVLHDVAAATRAAMAMDLRLAGVVLVAPESPDASTGTNARELSVVTSLPVLAQLPRSEVSELAARADLEALVRTHLTRRD